MTYITDNFQPESFYQGFDAPEGGIYDQDNEPDEIEDKTCERCGEIEEECECSYYDSLEFKVAQNALKAEKAMGKLKKIEIEIKQRKT